MASKARHIPQVSSLSCQMPAQLQRCDWRRKAALMSAPAPKGRLRRQYDSYPLSGSRAAWISILGP